MTKPVFTDGSAEAQAETRATLVHCLEVVLRALHPYMPFITDANSQARLLAPQVFAVKSEVAMATPFVQ